MAVSVFYAGQAWRLAENVDRTTCQEKIVSVGKNGGFVELELALGGTIAVVVGPGVPVALIESD
ncbi:hypothetical protein OH802_05685 [Nocardioides sp. NBC_00850]|uniref:hypothetical protein n=1 Tax=Nocardioides sp. NBC_00850 TaxID=2976001 RepID=UPI003865AA9F|nr:hypothetical protein OH802_05685 [Nocardioides sp. NBC_00850]